MLPFQNKRPDQPVLCSNKWWCIFSIQNVTHFISTWLLYELPGRADTCDEKYLLVWNFKEIKHTRKKKTISHGGWKLFERSLVIFFSYFVLIIFFVCFMWIVSWVCFFCFPNLNVSERLKFVERAYDLWKKELNLIYSMLENILN